MVFKGVNGEYDLSPVCTIVSDYARTVRRRATAAGIAILVGIPAALGLVLVFGVREGSDLVFLVAAVIWGIGVAWLGGALGLGIANRLAPGPIHLTIDASGVSWLFGDGRRRTVPWTGASRTLRLYSRDSAPPGVPIYSLAIAPSYAEVFLAYRRAFPIIPLTRPAFEGILAAVRSMGISIGPQPSSKFLGSDAPGISYAFELPLAM